MRGKKGAIHVDWAVSLGIFLVFILGILFLLKPTEISDVTGQDFLAEFILNELLDSAKTTVEFYPFSFMLTTIEDPNNPENQITPEGVKIVFSDLEDVPFPSCGFRPEHFGGDPINFYENNIFAFKVLDKNELIIQDSLVEFTPQLTSDQPLCDSEGRWSASGPTIAEIHFKLPVDDRAPGLKRYILAYSSETFYCEPYNIECVNYGQLSEEELAESQELLEAVYSSIETCDSALSGKCKVFEVTSESADEIIAGVRESQIGVSDRNLRFGLATLNNEEVYEGLKADVRFPRGKNFRVCLNEVSTEDCAPNFIVPPDDVDVFATSTRLLTVNYKGEKVNNTDVIIQIW